MATMIEHPDLPSAHHHLSTTGPYTSFDDWPHRLMNVTGPDDYENEHESLQSLLSFCTI